VLLFPLVRNLLDV